MYGLHPPPKQQVFQPTASAVGYKNTSLPVKPSTEAVGHKSTSLPVKPSTEAVRHKSTTTATVAPTAEAVG